MVTVIRLYVEGDSQLRPGFIRFFGRQIEQARERGIRFHIRLTGSKDRTLGAFLIANHENPGDLNVYLIDSDRSDDGTLWQELLQRKDQHRRWRRLRTPERKQAHWMVQAMEAWFLADRAALRHYYGQRLRVGGIPGSEATVEDIGNPDSVLKTATQDTQKGRYHKTQHAPDLLESVDVGKVRGNAPACARLLRTLEGVLA